MPGAFFLYCALRRAGVVPGGGIFAAKPVPCEILCKKSVEIKEKGR